MNLEKYFKKDSKSKADFEMMCKLIIEQREIQYATLLLKNVEFYQALDLPSKIKDQVLLVKLGKSTLKIVEIISFVKFSQGSGINFFRNLIFFQFEILDGFNTNERLQLQQAIGLIISDFWWQYEYFKRNTENNDPQNYALMAESVIKYQNGDSQYIELKILSQINREIRTIINNSTSKFDDYQAQSEKLDFFFQIIINRGRIDFRGINSYISSKSIFSRKYRCLYFRLLFYYISLKYFNNEQQQLDKVRYESDALIELFLKENVINFSNHNPEIKSHFEQIDHKQNQIIQSLSDINQFKTVQQFIRSKDLQQFQDQLLTIHFEKFLSFFKDKWLLQQFYNIIYVKQNSLLNEIIKIQDSEFSNECTVQKQLQLLQSYLADKSEDQISFTFLAIENSLHLSKKELKCIKQAYQLKSQDIIACCQLILLIIKINSQQDVIIFLKQQFTMMNSHIVNFQRFQLNCIINQKRLKNLIFLLIQQYLEVNHNQTLFELIEKFLLQIEFYQTQDLLKFFQISFCRMQFKQLKDICTVDSGSDKEEIFEKLLIFVKEALEKSNSEDKLVILNNIQFVSFSAQDLHVDFLKQHLNESPQSLILYLQILFYMEIDKQDRVEQYSLELYRKNLIFFQKHIKHQFQEKFALSEPDEILLGKDEAQQFSISILNKLQLFNYKQEQDTINQKIQSETISSKEFIIRLEKSDATKSPESFYEYSTNQLKFIQQKANVKAEEIRNTFKNKIIEANQSLEKIQVIIRQFTQFFQNLKQEKLKSAHYFKEELGLSHEKANLLMHQIVYDYTVWQDTRGTQLFQDELQNQFEDTVDDMNSKQKYQFIEDLLELNEENKKITCLHSFLETLVDILENKLKENKKLNDKFQQANLDDQLNNLIKSLVGCEQLCPICKKKCDQNPTQQHQHKCENGHQLRAMGGILVNNKPSLFCCEELEDDFDVFDQQINCVVAWHTLKQNYQDWNFSTNSSSEIKTHQINLTNQWDKIYGEYFCKKMRTQFILKQKLDVQDFRGKNIVLSQQQQVKKFHYILVLDDSGSMAGSRFTNAVQGAKKCLQLFITNKAIRLTVIMFNNGARVVVGQNGPEQINVQQQIEKIKFQGGGTNFNCAFQEIFTCLTKCQENFDKHVILFYTDGEAGYPHQALNNLMSLNEQLKKKIQIIICCEGSGQESLTQMKDFFNTNMDQGKLFQKVRPEDLGNIWSENVTVTQLRRIPC